MFLAAPRYEWNALRHFRTITRGYYYYITGCGWCANWRTRKSGRIHAKQKTMSHHTVREFTSNDNKLASYVMVVRYEICIGMITGIAMTNMEGSILVSYYNNNTLYTTSAIPQHNIQDNNYVANNHPIHLFVIYKSSLNRKIKMTWGVTYNH